MKYNATSVSEYIAQIPEDKKESVIQLRKVILDYIPKGFKEELSYGMIGYVVPHELYPDGYHCNPKLPLPFVSLAAQKNFISLYHMGLYTDSELLNWFSAEYPKHSPYKLDMGKCCVRFKKPEAIPFELIQQLIQKISPEEYIEIYKRMIKKT
ncbi:DUF1801 domain-containing protein [Flavobacterium agrisoli]|uniref:DUF1801 domain-containing protein n=1 Tax=Flavobacterium agrisoli TaxID=2793066 RepID=A0A934UIJ9_9FLAO|nr:DUF1801 domain-containing protein [Flavobacterium agrisoli]MBK0368460.1 DUF1801 domain-containing protein [Flavobacterium agrisoli]